MVGKTGLVLSGGASRFYAQLGVVKVFYERGFRPDIIVGCSAGALLGTCLAAGMSPEDIEDKFYGTNPLSLMDFSLSKNGLMKGEKVVNFVLSVAGVKDFKDLKIPLKINATDINSMTEIVFDSGDLASALNASIAFPGVFAPKKIGDSYYVDGGISNALPLDLLPVDVDKVLAVDVSFYRKQINADSSALLVLNQSAYILQRKLVDETVKKFSATKAFIMVRPDVQNFRFFELKKSRYKDMIKLGRDAALAALETKKAKLLIKK